MEMRICMKRFKLSKIHVILIAFALLIIYIACGLYADLKTTTYDLSSNKLPKSFDGFKIANISDLHCSYFGENQEDLIEAIKEYNPDIIVLTGDIIDENNIDFNCVEKMLSGICDIAPIYSVSGNHELSHYKAHMKLKRMYESYGVNILENEEVSIIRDGEEIRLFGLAYIGSYGGKSVSTVVGERMPKADDDYYSILLHHRSDIFDSLSLFGYDLVIAGHTHGGVIRLPFVGGVLSNDHTLFPEYDGGIFIENDSTMISSKGLGESNSIPRFYNRRELVFITLHCE